jgi:hypothetical protein
LETSVSARQNSSNWVKPYLAANSQRSKVGGFFRRGNSRVYIYWFRNKDTGNTAMSLYKESIMYLSERYAKSIMLSSFISNLRLVCQNIIGTTLSLLSSMPLVLWLLLLNHEMESIYQSA